VLGLAITSHLYPLLEADRFGAGRLTKIRAQTVSGAACREVAVRLDVPGRLAAAAPEGTPIADTLVSERVLSSIVEAIIGACYLEQGYEATAAAVVDCFGPELALALEHPIDFKSALQEQLAARGQLVEYEITSEDGPPHERSFAVTASVAGEVVGRGVGRTKKAAEQEAARIALGPTEGGD
jgi:ribonuclease-3